MAGLTLDSAGNLYGTASQSGSSPWGGVFELSPSSDGNWTQTVLYAFTGGADGGTPVAGVIFDSAGNLYGTTQVRGNFGCGNGRGVAFKLSPGPDKLWTQSVIYTFGNWSGDGETPSAGLIFDAKGNLYGTTFYGGSGSCNDGNGVGCGTVFELKPMAGGGWATLTFEVRVSGPK